METTFFLRGLIIGISVAAPVGPIGVLCIRRTLAEGRTSGIVSGLGAASADAVYGCVAGFGLTFVSGLFVSHKVWLSVLGGIFLCYLGLRIFRAAPASVAASVEGRGLIGAYSSTFILTLTNPMTIVSFASIFAGLGLIASSGTYIPAAALISGVFLGSALWWVTLSGAVDILRTRLSSSHLRWVNRVCAGVLVGFGLTALIGLG